MNLKTIAATVLFSCALVACSKQDNKTTAQTKQAQTKPKDCKLIKDKEERRKCVHDKYFAVSTSPTISRPATSY